MDIKVEKNNILLFIIVVLIILLVIFSRFFYTNLLNKETFQVFDKCMFYAWGPTYDSCVNNCLDKSRIGLWDEDGKNCSIPICERKCRECKNEEACQWLHSWSSETGNVYNNEVIKPTSPLQSEYPKEFVLSGISYPDTESSNDFGGLVNIKLFWTNNGDASKYMIHYYDMMRSENMITVETIDSNADRGRGEHELKGIRASTEYSIIMYAINEYGISMPSNLITLKT